MNRLRNVLLLCCCFSFAGVPAAQGQGVLGDAFKRFDTEQDGKKTADKTAEKPAKKRASEDPFGTPDLKKEPAAKDEVDEKAAGDKKLKAFFEEVEALLEGQDDFGKIVKKLKEDLKSEFRENESELNEKFDPKKHTQSDDVVKLEARQKVIAQLHIEFGMRTGNTNGRGRFDLQQKVSGKFRDFSRKNRELARRPEFSRKQRELTQKAMQRGGGFGGGMHNMPSMGDTIRSLSRGKVVNRKTLGSSRVHPGEQAGPIQDMRYGLRSLLKLKWDGQKLAIDRAHWDDAFAGRTVDNIRREVDSLLDEAGAVGTGENEDAVRMRRHNMHSQSNVSRVFNELRGGGMNGYSRSGSGQDVRMSFSNGSVNARLTTSATRFELMIEEQATPNRVMRIVDDEKGFQIVLVGDMVHRFRQAADSSQLAVVEVVENDVISHSVTTFAELYRDHPRFVEDRFFALLDHLGIVPPASRFDPQIVKRVVEYLGMDRQSLKAEVEKLVVGLDSDRFTEREAAFAKLRVGIDEYYDLLHAKQSDSSLSPEANARIKKLMSLSESVVASHFDSVISTLGLIDNIEYLQEVRTIVDDESKAILDRQIAALLK